MELESKAAGLEDREVKQAYDEMMRTFETFRADNDQRMAELEKRGGDVVTEEKVERINRALTEQKKHIDQLMLAAARPQLSGEFKAAGDQAARERKTAFDRYARKGDAGGLDSIETKSLSEGSNADGGYTVPLEIERTIDRVLATASPIRAIATVRQIGSGVYRKPITTSGAASGWVGETGSISTTGAPTLAALDFPAMELYAMPAATQTLLDDSQVDIEQWLADEVQIVFAAQEGAAFVNGDGSSKPTGFLAYTNVADASWSWGNIGYIASGAAGAFADDTPADALLNLAYAPKQGYRANGRWVMNRKTESAIRNAVSLILKSGASRVTAAGDTAAYVSDGGGNWRELYYQRASLAASAADVCAAGPGGTALTSSGLGLGMTPVNILDICLNQNTAAVIGLLNNSSGANANATFRPSNGGKTAQFGILGTNFSSSGVLAANSAFVYAPDATGGLALGSAGPIKIGAGGLTETARFGSDGSLLLGSASQLAESARQLICAPGNSVNCLDLNDTDGVNTAIFTGFYTTGTRIGSITNAANTGVAFNTTSDETLKGNWRVLERDEVRGRIMGLFVGEHDWKTNTAAPRAINFKAQQGHAVHPQAFKPGNGLSPWMRSVGEMEPLLTLGLQHAFAELVELRAEVAALKKDRPAASAS